MNDLNILNNGFDNNKYLRTVLGISDTEIITVELLNEKGTEILKKMGLSNTEELSDNEIKKIVGTLIVEKGYENPFPISDEINTIGNLKSLIISTLMSDDEDKFQLARKNFSDFARQKKEEFLKFKIYSLNEIKSLDYETKHHYCIKLYFFYQHLFLFPDDEIINKFKEIGFSDENLFWFIPFTTIIKEMDKIIEKDIVIFRFQTFLCIHSYIHSSIIDEVHRFLGMIKIDHSSGWKYANDLFHTFRKRYDREEYNKYKNTEYIFEGQELIESLLGRKRVEEEILDMVRGDYAKVALNMLFIKDKQSKAEIHRAFFDIFKLILPTTGSCRKTYSIKSESEFNKNEEKVNVGLKSVRKNYKTYKAKRVTDILKSIRN